MGAGSGRPSTAVLVGLPILRRIIMNYTLDPFDIDSPGRYISSYQCHTFSIDEALHGLVTLILTQSTMDCSYVQVSISQFLSNPVDSSTGTTENHTATSFSYYIAGQFGFSPIGH